MLDLIKTTPEIQGARTQALVTKTGRACGDRVFFGKLSASEIRAAGKAQGLKGTALTKYVNNGLSDGQANKLIGAVALVQKAATEGYVADYMDIRSKSATLRFVKPTAVKTPEEAAAEVFGCSIEELRAAISMVKK